MVPASNVAELIADHEAPIQCYEPPPPFTPFTGLRLFTMDVGTQHLARIEPFLLMSKAAKGAAAAKLIQDATSAPGVFVFGELLEQPNIQEVRLYHVCVQYGYLYQ